MTNINRPAYAAMAAIVALSAACGTKQDPTAENASTIQVSADVAKQCAQQVNGPIVPAPTLGDGMCRYAVSASAPGQASEIEDHCIAGWGCPPPDQCPFVANPGSGTCIVDCACVEQAGRCSPDDIAGYIRGLGDLSFSVREQASAALAACCTSPSFAQQLLALAQNDPTLSAEARRRLQLIASTCTSLFNPCPSGRYTTVTYACEYSAQLTGIAPGAMVTNAKCYASDVGPMSPREWGANGAVQCASTAYTLVGYGVQNGTPLGFALDSPKCPNIPNPSGVATQSSISTDLGGDPRPKICDDPDALTRLLNGLLATATQLCRSTITTTETVEVPWCLPAEVKGE